MPGAPSIEGKRKALYKDAQQLVWNDAPWVFLWTPEVVRGHGEESGGRRVLPIEKWDAAMLRGSHRG